MQKSSTINVSEKTSKLRESSSDAYSKIQSVLQSLEKPEIDSDDSGSDSGTESQDNGYDSTEWDNDDGNSDSENFFKQPNNTKKVSFTNGPDGDNNTGGGDGDDGEKFQRAMLEEARESYYQNMSTGRQLFSGIYENGGLCLAIYLGHIFYVFIIS